MEKKDELKNDLTREEKILLEEYRNAQLSAQHHDTLVWTVTSIFWATNALLLRVVVTVLTENKLKGLPIFLSLLGIFLCLIVQEFARQFNDIMKKKYKRCKYIEEELKVINPRPNFEKGSKVMRQHSDLEYSPGEQKKMYGYITRVFIALWVGIIFYEIKDILVIFFRPFKPLLEYWIKFYSF